jgi:exodeoxyribonuclease VII large subunit
VVDRSRIEAPEAASDGVVWLYDPALDANLHPPMTCRPNELFGVLDDVLTEAGIEDVVVTGTVRGLRRRARWWGFDLVEMSPAGDTPAATLRCVVFARHIDSIETELSTAGMVLADGAVAAVTGTLGVNPPWGELRVVVAAISIRDERSAETEARERLIAQLVSSGQAAAQRRLVVPSRPRRIGILAGAGTAGAADLEALLDASEHDWQLRRRAVPMAGARARAAEAVAGGIRTLAERRSDVIVVARGVGAAGEMAWADSATVATAITRCPVPVWTAIGHATDRAVADLVAHRSCPTPSSAAAGLIAMVDDDTDRRWAVATEHVLAAALAGVAARARIAWIVAAVVLVVLVAVVVSGLGR